MVGDNNGQDYSIRIHEFVMDTELGMVRMKELVDFDDKDEVDTNLVYKH